MKTKTHKSKKTKQKKTKKLKAKPKIQLAESVTGVNKITDLRQVNRKRKEINKDTNNIRPSCSATNKSRTDVMRNRKKEKKKFWLLHLLSQRYKECLKDKEKKIVSKQKLFAVSNLSFDYFFDFSSE